MNSYIKAVRAFEQGLMTRRVASRFAMEHATPEARDKYLHEHPKAEPRNHTVKKDEPSKSKAEPESK